MVFDYSKIKKIKVHVILTNYFETKTLTEIDISNCICAVIDTIRATSTITTMLACGGKNVIIASNKSEALGLKNLFPDHLLCGEEGGLAPEGFDYGNSPLEISGISIKNKSFILMTTNGTRSFFAVKDFSDVYALSILNLNTVMQYLIESASSGLKDILLLCSGEKGKVAYDDAYTAGLAIKFMLTRPYSFEFSDTAKLVLSAALCEFDINSALEKSCSARSLRKVTNGNDIEFLSHINRYRVVPKLEKSTLKKIIPDLKRVKNLKIKHKDFIYIMKSCT